MAIYRKLILLLSLPAVCGGTLLAQSAQLGKAQMKAAIQTETLAIPTPGEFFAAINKQGKPNWPNLIRKPAIQNSSDRAQIALNLGTLVADGYIAVEAQDGQQVKNVGKDIIALAKALGVSQDIISRGNTINDFAENNDWSGLNEELEATENEVKLTMEKQNDTALITLVTLGGWIRGVQAVSGIISKNYTPSSAKLLRQPAVIQYLLSQIGMLSSRMQENVLVKRVKAELEATEKLVNTPPDGTISDAAVKEIHERMSKLIEEISNKPEGAAK